MVQTQVTVPYKWSNYMFQLFAGGKLPVCGTLNVDELEALAAEKCKDHMAAYLYVFGSAGTSSTQHVNRKAFDRWRLVPRMLQDAAERTLETTFFGVKYPSPLMLCPVGVQGIVHPDAEFASTAAAAKCGVPYIASSASTRSAAAMAKNLPNELKWYQLYWPKTDDILLSLLSTAQASGYNVLVVTLDTAIIGWRPHDLDTAYLPFYHGVGVQTPMADPVFMKRFGFDPIPDGRPEFPYDPAKLDRLCAEGDPEAKKHSMLGREWLMEANSGLFQEWKDLKILQENWKGPIVLKGVQRVDDAERALDAGVDGIVVSNHGGRQVDGAVPSLWALEQICASPKIKAAQESGKFTVLYDSGIRTGSDGLKAIALGAQGIGLGRPYMHGLTLAGEAGVEEVIRSFLGDMEVTLGLLGCRNLKEIWYQKDAVMQRTDL